MNTSILRFFYFIWDFEVLQSNFLWEQEGKKKVNRGQLNAKWTRERCLQFFVLRLQFDSFPRIKRRKLGYPSSSNFYLLHCRFHWYSTTSGRRKKIQTRLHIWKISGKWRFGLLHWNEYRKSFDFVLESEMNCFLQDLSWVIGIWCSRKTDYLDTKNFPIETYYFFFFWKSNWLNNYGQKLLLA